MTTLCSYDLNGKKLSFANWISNLSPQETPFTSMTGKESVDQTLFQWQTDFLAKAGKNAKLEGAEASEDTLHTTQVKSNVTQILRKTVKVSDTANALANYGRGRELQYQMEKAGKEIKRDLEWVFLNNKEAVVSEKPDGHGGVLPRKTAGFRGLVAPYQAVDQDTGASVHRRTHTDDVIVEKDLFDLTYNLYLAGSKADIIMFHPKWASFFSSLQEKATPGSRQRIFENTPKFSVYVSTIVDPLGQEYKLIPNRWMPVDQIYVFNSSDWTQMVLRAPQRTKLAKDGSYEKWMIEMEVGLRHRNPFASGILDIDHSDSPVVGDKAWTKADAKFTNLSGGTNELSIMSQGVKVFVKTGGSLEFTVKSKDKITPQGGTEHTVAATDILYLMKDGVEFGHWTGKFDDADKTVLATNHAGPQHNGRYTLVYKDKDGNAFAATATLEVHVQS